MTKALVLGSTGCIGNNIVRACLEHGWQVRAFHRRDSETWMLEGLDVERATGDLGDSASLVSAAQGCDVVFHAAALKHVPACEYNPFEAVQTNVVGTQNVLTASREAGVARVVTISTDKAVSPANTMGATNPVSATPGTLRADYGREIGRNLVHGSDGPETAVAEIALWFDQSEILSYERDVDRWILE